MGRRDAWLLLGTLLVSCGVRTDGNAGAGKVQELVLDSPHHIDILFKRSLKEFSSKVQEEEGGTRGTGCSKDEHCKEDERCSRIGRCRPKASAVSDACRYGFITCAHEEDSPIRKIAVEEADKRLALGRPEADRALQIAMLPAPAQPVMSLPAPPSITEASDGENGGALMDQQQQYQQAEGAVATMESYVKSVELVEKVANGALTASGALPTDTHKWSKLAAAGKERVTRRPFYNYWDKEDRVWRLATRQLAEEIARNNTNTTFLKSHTKQRRKTQSKMDEEMLEWFREGGGKLAYASVSTERSSWRGRRGAPKLLGRVGAGTQNLVVNEDLSEGDVVLEVPLKLVMNQLTCHRVKTQRGRYLGELFGGAIAGRYADWGLAGFLLVELGKGNSSKWWPFIRTLRMRVMSSEVLSELEGTYTGKLLKELEESSESATKYLDKIIDHKDPLGNIKGAWAKRKDMRWGKSIQSVTLPVLLMPMSDSRACSHLVLYSTVCPHIHPALLPGKSLQLYGLCDGMLYG